TTDQDFAGEKKSVSSNGKNDYRYDANFNLTQNVSVKGLKIVAENGSQKEEWDTIPESKSPVVVVIDGSKNILNKTDGSVSFAGNTNCILLVDDKAGLLSKSGTTSKIYVTLSDGRMLEKTATAGKKVVADNSLTVDFRGTGKYDFVGQSKKLEANMNPDSFVTVTVNAKGKITGVRLSNLKNNAMWDTVPSSSANLAALLTSDGKKLNKADGSVAVEVNGTEEFNIAFDEASDAGTGPYKVTIVFDDGRLMEGSSAASTAADTKSAKRRGRGSSESNADQTVAADREVVFTSAKPQSVALDLVGKNKKKGANGAKDMALTIKATGKGTIRTMVLSCSDGTGWDTLSSNNGRWLLGVREGSKLLNAANGTIKLDVNGTKTYQLLMQNNGKLNAKTGKLL
ncbi:MAG: hypothetical protein HUJ86_00330, partial [Synergistes sp.]|nr:hypothetical protein [Synergistes sp.]